MKTAREWAFNTPSALTGRSASSGNVKNSEANRLNVKPRKSRDYWPVNRPLLSMMVLLPKLLFGVPPMMSDVPDRPPK